MASTSRMSLQHDHGDGYNKVKVTILASEWGSSKGGLSTINRELAIQLAKCPEVEITLFLPQCSKEDKNVALKHNIMVLDATRRPGFKKLEWLSFPPEYLQIDIIVGHGVKLGRQAQVIRESKKCKWVQVVHTDPEELGMFKDYPNPISKGEEKHKTEVELCEMADMVVGVGPKLSEVFRSYLRGCQKDQNVFDFTPGILEEFTSVKQVADDRKLCSVLVFGSGDAEDFALKGFDIAGKAVATLPDTRLVFVGAPNGKHEEIAKRLTGCGVSGSRLRVRGFLQNRDSLKRLFQEVDLVLMPSRTEGFGLTGLEALSAGLPVLASQNSGFGEALSKVTFGSSSVIYSEDPTDWATAIKKIWDKDRKRRLEEAETVRDSYKEKYDWAKQIKDLLKKMISLYLDDSSDAQSPTQTEGGMLTSAGQAFQQRSKDITEHYIAFATSVTFIHVLPMVIVSFMLKSNKDIRRKSFAIWLKLVVFFCLVGILEHKSYKDALSCKEHFYNGWSQDNKAYPLKLGSVVLPVYCHMTDDLGACGSGGWTLVMKIDGNQQTFHYDSSLWSNNETFNLEGGETGLDTQETKLPTYWNTAFSKICLGMKIGQQINYIVINKHASSLYSLIADGNYRYTSLGRNTWKTVIGSQASLQHHCNKEGFNAICRENDASKARIGITANNEDNCDNCDSRIGFGTGGYQDNSNSCGNQAMYGGDNGGQHIKAMGYIFIQ